MRVGAAGWGVGGVGKGGCFNHLIRRIWQKKKGKRSTLHFPFLFFHPLLFDPYTWSKVVTWPMCATATLCPYQTERSEKSTGNLVKHAGGIRESQSKVMVPNHSPHACTVFRTRWMGGQNDYPVTTNSSILICLLWSRRQIYKIPFLCFLSRPISPVVGPPHSPNIAFE